MSQDQPRAGSATGVAPTPDSGSVRKKCTKLAGLLRSADSEGKLHKHWRTYFLAALVETSNVKASAEHAGISPSRAYKVRSEDLAFAAQWHAAMLEGYEHLEMETLAYLRSGDPTRKMDVAAAIRLLLHHAETVARQRALQDNRSEQDVLDSINAMIDEMRERAATNAALLARTKAENNHGDR